MFVETKCTTHTEQRMQVVCSEELCCKCEEARLATVVFPKPPKRHTVPVWEQHHNSWNLSNSVPN